MIAKITVYGFHIIFNYYIVLFAENLYGIKIKRKNATIFIILAALSTATIEVLFQYSAFIRFPLIEISRIYILYKCTEIRLYFVLIAETLADIVSFLGETVTMGAVIIYFNVDQDAFYRGFWYEMVGFILTILLWEVLVRVIKKFNVSSSINIFRETVNLPKTIYIVTIFLFSVFNLYYIRVLKVTNEIILGLHVIVAAVLYIISFAFVLNRYIVYVKSQEAKQLHIYIKAVNELYSDLRNFRISYEQDIIRLKELLENNNLDKLKDYYSQMLDETEAISKSDKIVEELNKIKSPSLFGLISAKIGKAEHSKVNFEIDVFGQIDRFHMKTTDFIEIIGIFIDNAIEAAEKSIKKSINIRIISEEKTITIIIKNSFSGEISTKGINEKNYSTKGENRGLGLWIAKKIIERYTNVTHDTRIAEDTFIQELIIKKLY